jgi:hypothetical protein
LTSPLGDSGDARPDFKGYLLWYVLLQCCLAIGIFVAAIGYGFIAAIAGLADPWEVEMQLSAADMPLRVLSAVICIALAIVVASRHGVTFGPGLGGYILGNIVTAVATAPLIYGLEPAVNALPYPADLLLLIGAPLAYIFGLTAAIVVLRRSSARLGSVRAAIAQFDCEPEHAAMRPFSRPLSPRVAATAAARRRSGPHRMPRRALTAGRPLRQPGPPLGCASISACPT